MPDVGKAVSMDLKKSGNLIYMIGLTRHELGGSEYLRYLGFIGQSIPKVDIEIGKSVFSGLSLAADRGLVRSMHDCSDGGLAVTLAEMAFAGELGLTARLEDIPVEGDLTTPALLFSESQSRIVAEVAPGKQADFEAVLSKANAPFALIGQVETAPSLKITHNGKLVINSDLATLKTAWKKPLSKI
jgi:phosphoribosylformylglycinamidine synthase